MEHFWQDNAWSSELSSEALGSAELMLMYTKGTCLSMHSRGCTFKSALPNGQAVFIKRDHYTMLKDTWGQLLHFRRPVPRCIREWRICDHLLGLGFDVPKVIAACWRTHGGLPLGGGIVMLPVSGTPLDRLVSQAATRAEAETLVSCARDYLKRLQAAGVDWPDSKAEHFMMRDDGSVGIIDVERARFRKPSASACARQFKRLELNLKWPQA